MQEIVDVIDTGVSSAIDSMQLDAQWITALSTFERPRIRFYDWERKSITYGHFIDSNKWLTAGSVEHLGFDIARRPTGGGLIFHYNDFSYTVAIPSHHPKFSQNVLSNYHLINSALLEAVSHIQGSFCLQEQSNRDSKFTQFCMATATQYDLIYGGRKLGGSAQRKTAHGFVHQGTLFITPPNWQEMGHVLQSGQEAIEAMQACSVALLPFSASKQEIAQVRTSLQNAFVSSLVSML
jgi:lipoate---protein ligase